MAETTAPQFLCGVVWRFQDSDCEAFLFFFQHFFFQLAASPGVTT